MIHYTLLPEAEIQKLKREYRSRVFIVLMFFVSFSVIIGMVALFPAYILSTTQANDSIRKFDTVQKSRESRGIDLALKELKQSNDIVKKLKADDSNLQFSIIIQKVLENRLPDITFNAIQISKSNDKSASSSMEVIVQGKSQSRESLLSFKKNLEANPAILKVDLPISDLAKSKNIAFAFKLLLKKQDEN